MTQTPAERPKTCEFCGDAGAVVFVEEWLYGDREDEMKTQPMGGWACDPCAKRHHDEVAQYECRKELARDGYGRKQVYLHRKHTWMTPVPQMGTIMDECHYCHTKREHR